MKAGASVTALAEKSGVSRKLLYEWRDALAGRCPRGGERGSLRWLRPRQGRARREGLEAGGQ